MAPRIVVIGGGSFQWVPKLVCDVLKTPSLAEAEIVLEDIAAKPVAQMGDLARHLVDVANVPVKVHTTTDQRAALEGADYVVVTISTGAFDSMRHDLAVPAQYGIKQSVGDTVGPGGVMRALRNVPVLLGIARDMEEVCPDAWMLNITNPMTALCRAVTRETSIATVGLCHEVTMAQYTLSQLLDVDFRAIDLTVTGVNHLPLVTALSIDGEDGFERLRQIVADAPDDKRDLLRANQVKLALFERFGVLPAAGDRHLVEFFPGFLTEASGWGKRWGVRLTTIEEREQWLEWFRHEFAELQKAHELPREPSGEMVAPVIDCFMRDVPRAFPLNLPNAGQCPDISPESVVESMCVVDGRGMRGRDTATAPPVLAEWLRRIVASQEATVEAAVSGSRDRVVEAMLLDPLAGRIDFEHVEQMTDEMLAATKRWLPQFS